MIPRSPTPIGAIVIAGMMVGLAGRWFDGDLYWHLANGRLIAAGGFPSPDQFSWSAAGGAYLAYSTPFDLVAFGLWRAGGAPLLALAASLLAGLVLLPLGLLLTRRGARPLIEASTILLVALALSPFLGARPQVVAFALFAGLVAIVGRPFGPGRATVAGLALGLWANLHGTFLVGFGLVGAAALTWALARQRRAAGLAAASLVLGGALSLLSPNGPALWRGPFATVSNAYLAYNHDWVGLRPFTAESAAAALLVLAAFALGAWRRDDPRALAAAGLLLPSIQLARFSPFLALLLGGVVLDRALCRWPRLALPPGSPQRAFLTSRGAAAFSWSILLLSVIGAGAIAGVTATAALAAPPTSYPSPRGATDALLTCGAPAPVWNDYNWGGYLIWRGEGRFLVGIDGRAETVYPDRVFARYVRVLQGQPGWPEIVQESPAQYALVTSDALAAIDRLPGWRRVYSDTDATVAARDEAIWRCTP